MTTFTDNNSQMTRDQTSLDFYDFCVPEHLVAQQPLSSRKNSRLLVADKDSVRSPYYVTDLADLLPQSSLLIFNDTKVFPSRMIGNLATGGKVELFLLSLPNGQVEAKAKALGRPNRKLRVGTKIFFRDSLTATIMKKEDPNCADTPSMDVSFNRDEARLAEWISKFGITPLPPYIKRQGDSNEGLDRERYQTVYANQEGSVAAPTAGLHFDSEQLSALKSRGIEIAYTTLHVGAGTFFPVKETNIENHRMHEESYSIPFSTWNSILKAKQENRPIIGVGTTSFRSIESFWRRTQCQQTLTPQCEQWLKTDLYIYPTSINHRYHSEIFDGLITNFHQPKSTLYLLISALMGIEKTKEIYRTAIAEEFRFFSYGDSSLLWF